MVEMEKRMWSKAVSGHKNYTRPYKVCIDKLTRFWLVVCLVACGLVARSLQAGSFSGPVVISEFMASNERAHADEDGHYTDWVEAMNLTGDVVNLDGWHLTDDAGDLQKWRFPAVELAANESLVIFASGKDRRIVGNELHTNFTLGVDGGYLALIDSDGTIATQFTPGYGPQRTDVSHGFPQQNVTETLVADGAPGKYLVPTGDVSPAWMLPGFPDASWTPGTNGFGFDQKSRPTYHELISTDVGAEMRGSNATILIRIPFNVAKRGSELLRLGMHFEDGFVAYVNGTRIAGRHAPDVLDWNSGATNSNLTATALEGEEFFTGNVPLEPGENILAIHGLNRSLTSSDAVFRPVLERVAGLEQADENLYFAEPTPNAPNGDGFVGLTPDPQFSPGGSAFLSSQVVTLDGNIPGVTVRYTTTGFEPDENSTVFEDSITLTETTRLDAKAFRDGFVPSATVSHSYVAVSDNVASFTSHLPIVLLDSLGTSVFTSWRDTHIHIVNVDDSGTSSVLGTPDFSGLGATKRRGSSTQNHEKLNFSVEIRDPLGDDRDVRVLGMPPESDWVLWGPWRYDRAMIRNPWIYEISNQIGYQAVRTRFVEVFANQDGGVVTGPVPGGDYFGVYVLMEKIKRGPDRVDVRELGIADTAEPEISGGYLLKVDRPDPGDTGFFVNSLQMLFVDPKEEEILPVQVSWIQSYVQSFLNALNGPNFTNPDLGYARYIDVDNFIDFHILQEFSRNPDAHILSTYLKKDRNEKLAYAPLWDFDRTMGNDNDPRAENPQANSVVKNALWWGRLFQDPELLQKYRDRWAELRQNQMSTANMHAVVDSMAAEIGEAGARNFERWSQILNPKNWPIEIEQLKTWQQRRAEWLDDLYPIPPTLTAGSQLIEPPFEVGVDVPVGDVYYTLDGTDPRLTGGAVSATAVLAGSGGDFTVLVSPESHSQVRVLVPDAEHAVLGTTWTARLFDDSAWSLGTSGIVVGYDTGFDYADLIDFDVESEMFNQNSTVYIRIDFNVVDPSALSYLTLRMKYDDGFVAYLNGEKIAEDNQAAALTWFASASSDHPDAEALEYRNFNVSDGLEALVAGRNVLAIHGMNRASNSSDILFVPEVLGSAAGITNVIRINDFARVTTRGRRLGEWTAPARATFVIDDAMPLRVTELMYHPIPPDRNSPFNDDDHEFVEIKNTANRTVDLRGVRFTDGIEFDFTDSSVTSLGPQEYVVIVKNNSAFTTTYLDGGIRVAGTYEGQLANQGENVRLENGVGAVIQEFVYDDTWYPGTDGHGLSLNLVGVFDDPANWSTQAGWEAGVVLGTPGTDAGDAQLPGDANVDAILDIGDAIALVVLLFRGGVRELPCTGANADDGANRDLLDFDGNNQVDTTDVIRVLSYLFAQGDAHVLGTRCVRIGGCSPGCDG